MLFPLFNTALLYLHLAIKTNAGWKWYLKHKQLLITRSLLLWKYRAWHFIFTWIMKALSHYDKHLPGKFHYSIIHSKWFISLCKKSFTFFEMQMCCAFTSFQVIHGLLHFSPAVLYTWATSTEGWAGTSHLNKCLLIGTETNLVGKKKPFWPGHRCYRSGSWGCPHLY